MAIKISNQITITEHKKIIEIKEWYLATEQDSGVTIETEGWTEAVQSMTSTNKYLWNYEETIYSLGSSDVTKPVIIGVYGATGASLQIKYISSKTVPVITNNNVSAWSDTVPSPVDGEKIYMTQKLSTDVNWSTPIQISGTDGEDGSANVEINSDGYWVINGEITEVKAEGSDGETPTIEIRDGYWYINGENSDIKAQGEAGKDGSDIEYVYYRNNTGSTPSTPSYTNNQLTTGWTASPQGITETNKYEFVSIRTKQAGSTQWSAFSTPVIWSKWGEKGQDGDGVEYKYYLKNNSTAPTYSASDTKWTDEPTGVSINNQYEYVIQIKTINGVSTPAEKASLWAKYGEDGRGIASITNYYATTTDASVSPSESDWNTSVPELTPTNKYLWNYEYILYTDGTSLKTDAAIIGAYGDSGASGDGSVDFQIYSVDGFEFSDSVTTIELKTVALYGGSTIDSNEVSYQWKYWDDDTKNYENINCTSSSLSVSVNDTYAFTSIKCELTYGGITYEDYASLTQKTFIYTAVAKFFDGNNVVSANENYLIAYVELYKNNDPEESLYSKNIYISSGNSVSDSIITTDVSGSYADGNMMYFAYQSTYDNTTEYNVVLGKYSSSTKKWNVVESKYIYKNNLFVHNTSPVLFIPKEKIPRSLTVDFEVYENDNTIARTSAVAFDLNDPTVSSTAPTDPKEGQLWLDTSVSPSILKMWDGTEWVNSGYQNGNVVYTSKPIDGYSEGDLWILADGEACGEFGPGSMLRATTTSSTFDESHWVDVDEEATAQKKNIKQYFSFNTDTGLRIGQSDNKFYVNISSTRMSFCENQLVESSDQEEVIDPNEVVSISNRSATIRNLTVEDGATFNCEIKLGKFILKSETNGSLSLALAT